MNQDEMQDFYYEVKAALEEIFGISPTTEQMNEFFFNAVWPEVRRYEALSYKYNRVRAAWLVLEEELGQ